MRNSKSFTRSRPRPVNRGLTLEAIEAEIARRHRERQAEIDKADIAENREAILERCKTFPGFIKEAWHVVEPVHHLHWGWALDAMTDHMQGVFNGDIIRLLMNVPPGFMKSMMVCVFSQAYEWGPLGRRSSTYLSASWNEEFAVRDSRKTRDLIQSAWFQELWPDVHLTRTGEANFANSDFGTRTARPFVGLTSGRADRLVWDDPHSTEKAESDKDRARATRVFRESVGSRINDPVKSAIIGIMQRLHENDVSGVIEQLGMDYVKLILPMEFEKDRRCVTFVNGKQFFIDPRKREGELLFPERFPRDVVERDKIPLGEYGVAGQFQQRPTPREGGTFKRHWFDIVEAAPALGNKCRAWDLAATKGGGDFTVGVLMQRCPTGIYYILDVVRLRGSPKMVDDAIKNTATQDGKTVRIRLPQDPGQAGKSQRAAHYSLLDGWTVRILPVTGEKSVRATPLSSQAEAGNVKLVRGPWNAAFLEEIGMFPNASFDDQVDAAADAHAELVAMVPQQVKHVGPMILTAPRSVL
jgi:predicted phage terminase large subunit-like protein